MKHWESWTWTDELEFEDGFVGGTVCVFRDKRKADKRECLPPTFKSGRTLIMIWGSISLVAKCLIVILPET